MRVTGRQAVLGALTAAWVVGLAACGGGSSTTSSSVSSAAQQSASTNVSGISGSSGAFPTAITVAGGPDGSLTPTAGVACIPLGGTSVQVTITGTIGGTAYVLKFDAPLGATDLSSASAAGSGGVQVFFAPTRGGGSWAADPAAHQGSGTLTVDGTNGGRVALHLVPSTGSPVTTSLDVNGTYSCS